MSNRSTEGVIEFLDFASQRGLIEKGFCSDRWKTVTCKNQPCFQRIGRDFEA